MGGRYRLERPLGSGGMAAVWLANDERLGRPVAIKVIAAEEDREFRRRFRREAKVAASLQHPNLVTVYDYRAGSRPYLVMEYIEGGSLAERLRSGDPPPAESVAAQMLAALRCIHAAGVLHRDVKPENVLIDEAGRAHLTDFGIAETRGATSITRTGIVIGTETYLAPERRRGEPASERSDLYSLGVMLAMVTEHTGADAALWDLIERLRADDPGDRPRSAAAALAELERGERRLPGEPTAPLARPRDDGPPTEDMPAVAAPPPPRRQGRGRAAVLGGLAAIAVAAVAAIGLIGGGGEDDPRPAAKARAGGDGPAKSRPGPEKEKKPAPAAPGPKDTAQPVSERAGGAELNDQGYALNRQGRFDEAIPLLRRALEALRGSGDELTYNYALFNLAHALRMAGRPQEAIQLLRERLRFGDQRDVVARELQAALAELGFGGEGKPGRGPGGPPPKAEPPGHDHE